MKKTVIAALMMILVFTSAAKAETKNITRSEFAAAVAPYLAGYEPPYTEIFDDVNETTENAGAICLLGEYGILSCTDNKFNPSSYMKNDEVSAALAKVFIIRCGQIKQYNSATFINNFYECKEDTREYLHIAAALGLVAYNEENIRLPLARFIFDTELDSLLIRLDNCINNFVRITGDKITSMVTYDGRLISGVSENETIDYFMSINDTSVFESDDVYVIFSNYTEGMLKNISIKKYSDVKKTDFYVIHNSFNSGENCDELCIYLWDADVQKPIRDKITFMYN